MNKKFTMLVAALLAGGSFSAMAEEFKLADEATIKKDAKIYLVAEDYMEHPFFPMSDSCIKEIENYGFYTLYLNGHLFFLEVIPQTEADRSTYLNKLCEEHKIGGSIYAYLQEIFYIDQIDFTLRSLYATNLKLKKY